MTVAVDHNALFGPGGTAPATSGSASSSGPGNHSGAVPRIDPSLPQVFGRYLLVQRLSRGGMGEIFLAKHGLSGFEKLCVIKKVLPNLAEDDSFISRFIDEAQVAIKLQHVNMAQVFEVGRVGEEYFLAIEYVEGRDLRRTLQVMARQRRCFPAELALFIGREIANGLAYAHRRTGSDGSSLNLVHCDISPPNVLVSFEGETKVIDFGIAKSALRATATDPKMGFGKFGYMAPEQLIRGGVVDHRTDIYAAGVVLFELMTGQRLYELGQDGAAPDYRGLARAVSRGEHDLPSDIDPMLAPYDELVARALRPKAEDRYQTAAEFRDAIQTALVQVSPTISADQLGAFLREVFAEEMSAHQELVNRVANMHLEDFKVQLTTQSVETVSFALANMPLIAPPDGAPGTGHPAPSTAGRRGQRRSQQSTAIAGVMHTESGPTSTASSTGTVELGDLDLVPADATIGRPRRSWPMIAASAAVVVAVALVIVVATGSSGSSSPMSAKTAGVSAPRPEVESVPTRAGPVVESLPAEVAKDTAPVSPVEPVVKAAKVVDPPATPGKDRKRVRPEPHGKDGKDGKDGKSEPGHKDEPAPAKVDASAVTAKFKSVSREYRTFKQAYGSRLDGEWTDLATFAQYALKSPEKLAQLERKIDRFRSLMAAAQK